MNDCRSIIGSLARGSRSVPPELGPRLRLQRRTRMGLFRRLRRLLSGRHRHLRRRQHLGESQGTSTGRAGAAWEPLHGQTLHNNDNVPRSRVHRRLGGLENRYRTFFRFNNTLHVLGPGLCLIRTILCVLKSILVPDFRLFPDEDIDFFKLTHFHEKQPRATSPWPWPLISPLVRKMEAPYGRPVNVPVEPGSISEGP